jgi:hypothetical protein
MSVQDDRPAADQQELRLGFTKLNQEISKITR